MRVSDVGRLMRDRRAKGLVAALALVGGGVAAAAWFAGGNGHSVQVGAGTVANPASGVSVTIPDGWQELPRVERADPGEVLVVGTAARPAGEPIEACGTASDVPEARSGYVTLYEYSSHGPFPSPTGGWEYPYDAFQPRSPDFASHYGMGNDCDLSGRPIDAPVLPDFVVDPTATSAPPTTVPPPVNHFREFSFTEAGRVFLARVVTVDDASGDLLGQAFAILNSLRVDVPPVTTTTVYLGPPDEDAARQEIIDAIHSAFGTPSPVPFADSIEGGHPLATEEQKREAAETAKNADPVTRGAYEASQEGAIRVTINWIEWDSTTRATLNFDLLAHSEPITANTTGYAVFEDGHWRLGRGTWCEIAARGGVQCPT